MERYSQQFTITPSDSALIPQGPVDAIYVGAGDGTLSGIDDTGKAVTFAGLLNGHVYRFALRKVLQTGTGVTSLRGLKF